MHFKKFQKQTPEKITSARRESEFILPITPMAKFMIQQAAEELGINLSDFIFQAAWDRAKRALKDNPEFRPSTLHHSSETYLRVPTIDEFDEFMDNCADGKWKKIDAKWTCPSCYRSKFELLRYVVKYSSTGQITHQGWHANIVKHHDHGAHTGTKAPRFKSTLICGTCNTLEGTAKKRLNLQTNWSFSPDELRQFIKCVPHGGATELDLIKAERIYREFNKI